MSNFNKVYLMGNLTRDPELRYTPKGQPVAKLGMAINRKFTTEGQEREEDVFVEIEAWGKAAEVISQHCKKSRPLFVEGRLKLDQWDDKTTGQKRSALRVVLESFQFVGGRPASTEGETEKPKAAPVANDAPKAAPADDDVPF